MQTVTEEYKKDIYTQLANAMITGLENGDITNEDANKAATFTLERLDLVTKFDELTIFLQELAETWSIYKSVYDHIKGDQAANEDQQKMAEIQDKLKSLITPTV